MCNCSKKCNCNITQITKGEKGDTGPVGAASVERIKANQTDIIQSGDGGSASVTVNFTELTTDDKIITFDVLFTSEDATGTIGGTSITFTDGVTPINLFNVGSTAPEYGLNPAKVKFDKDPNVSPPTGYVANETINYIFAKLKINRSGTNGTIEGTIYGYNSDNQMRFGQALFTQKVWHLNHYIPSPDNFYITLSSADDGSGAYVAMNDILRYNL